MLLVPTVVRPSSIAGVGLFTTVDLECGTVVWEFREGVDWRLSPDEVEAFPEPFQSRMRHYLYLDESGMYILCGDGGKFMNHAEEPNCDDPQGPVTVACRAICAGEELTCDYRRFDMESRQRPALF